MHSTQIAFKFPEQLPIIDTLAPRSALFSGAGMPPLVRGSAEAQAAWRTAPDHLGKMLQDLQIEFPDPEDLIRAAPAQPPAEAQLCIRFDGCCVYNPGPMGIGIACFTPADLTNPVAAFNQIVAVDEVPIIGTNNISELVGAIQALTLSSAFIDLNGPHSILIQGDSLNTIRWITGEYRLNEQKLAPFVGYAQSLYESLRHCGIRIAHLPRKFNFVADELSKQAIHLRIDNKVAWKLLAQ